VALFISDGDVGRPAFRRRGLDAPSTPVDPRRSVRWRGIRHLVQPPPPGLPCVVGRTRLA
jgi:hypothetical protein